MKVLLQIKSKAEKLGEQALLSLNSFLLTILLGRYASAETFAQYALSFLWVLFGFALLQAYLLQPLSYFSEKNGKRSTQTQFISFFVIFQLLFLIGFKLFLVGYDALTHNRQAHLPLLCWAFSYNAFYFFRHLLIMHQNKKGQWRSVITFSLLCIGGISGLILLQELHYDYILYLLALALLSGSMVSYFHLPQVRPAALHQLPWKKHWIYARYLMATAVFQWFSGNAFWVAAGTLLAPFLFSGIRLVQNLTGLLNIGMMAIDNYLPFRWMKKLPGEKKWAQVLIRESLLPSVLIIFVCLLAWMFGESLMIGVYGKTYATFAHWIAPMAALSLLGLWSLELKIAARCFSQNGLILLSNIIVSLFSISIAPWLLKNFEIKGLLIGLGAAQFLMASSLLLGLIFWSHRIKEVSQATKNNLSALNKSPEHN
ncbi:hypothetical protein [Persicobacter sp. CCB-QB2]|uniref:hypothetical protein n=1 Tax=Persicobacter sp. CCB-QB2 TaxID=1561025 RepID=UPI0006A9B06B|nr:hypothetical protein [Persicobacter sp. CCB-QB2]